MLELHGFKGVCALGRQGVGGKNILRFPEKYTILLTKFIQNYQG